MILLLVSICAVVDREYKNWLISGELLLFFALYDSVSHRFGCLLSLQSSTAQHQYNCENNNMQTTSKQTQKPSALNYLFPSNTFLPVSAFMIGWYFIVLLTLTIQFALTIVFICFRSEQASLALRDVLLPILTAICAIDIWISFNTSFIKDGQLIQQRKQVFKKYLFSMYFCFDAIALAVVICQMILRYDFQDKLPFLNLLMMVKVIKAIGYDNLIKKYVIRSSSGLLYYAMVKNIILLALVCHIVGSFFYYIDVKMIEKGWYKDNKYGYTFWIKDAYAYNNIDQLPVFYQYCYGFYYAVVTLTGTAYGDLTPLNPTETAYTFMSVAMPMIIYAYLFSVIYNAISQRRKTAIQATKYKKQAKYYFRDIGLTEKMSVRFMNYLSFVYEKKVAVDSNYLEGVAPSVRDSYLKDTIQSSYDFSLFDVLTRPSFMIDDIKELIFRTIQQEIFPQRQTIWLNKTKKLFFISFGSVSHILGLKHKFSKLVPTSTFFGKFEFFSGLQDQTPNRWFEANQFTICQTIDSSRFYQLLRDPSNQCLFESVHMMRNQLLHQGQFELIGEICYFCEQKDHLISTCSRLRPKVDMDMVMSRGQKRNFNKNRFRQIEQPGRSKHFQSRKILPSKPYKAVQTHRQPIRDRSIQTTEQEIDMNRQPLRGGDVQRVHNWNIFYPHSSFV